MRRIEIATPKVFSLVFADLDKAFAVVGANGYIGRWKLPSFALIFEGEADEGTQWSDYKSIDFVKESKDAIVATSYGQTDEFQLGVVGTDDRQQ